MRLSFDRPIGEFSIVNLKNVEWRPILVKVEELLRYAERLAEWQGNDESWSLGGAERLWAVNRHRREFQIVLAAAGIEFPRWRDDGGDNDLKILTDDLISLADAVEISHVDFARRLAVVVRSIRERIAHETPDDVVRRFISANPATRASADVVASTGLSQRQVERTRTWDNHEESLLGAFLTTRGAGVRLKDINGEFGWSNGKVSNMKAWASYRGCKAMPKVRETALAAR